MRENVTGVAVTRTRGIWRLEKVKNVDPTRTVFFLLSARNEDRIEGKVATSHHILPAVMVNGPDR